MSSSADLPARLGGDEFALAVSHTSEHALIALADRLRERFGRATADLGATTTLSIGIASSDACDRRDLLAAADQALYRSKGRGGDGAEIHSARPNAAA